ncbi:hypothetical protein D3C85_1358590 [compost metagenome]
MRERTFCRIDEHREERREEQQRFRAGKGYNRSVPEISPVTTVVMLGNDFNTLPGIADGGNAQISNVQGPHQLQGNEQQRRRNQHSGNTGKRQSRHGQHANLNTEDDRKGSTPPEEGAVGNHADCPRAWGGCRHCTGQEVGQKC